MEEIKKKPYSTHCLSERVNQHVASIKDDNRKVSDEVPWKGTLRPGTQSTSNISLRLVHEQKTSCRKLQAFPTV